MCWNIKSNKARPRAEEIAIDGNNPYSHQMPVDSLLAWTSIEPCASECKRQQIPLDGDELRGESSGFRLL